MTQPENQPNVDDSTLTVERRVGRVRAILVAIQCVATRADAGIAVGPFCEDLEIMAQEELGRIEAVLGVDVLNRDC